MKRRIVIDELEFEMPFGKLAAKTWHEETGNCKRVLALHGLMDNAGTFDLLIPQLHYKDGLYVVGLDLPGHGKSSQLPPGISYSNHFFVVEIRRFLLELGWVKPVIKSGNDEGAENKIDKKFTILAHSLGAGLSLFYASLFPNEVEEIILLEFFKTKTHSAEEELNRLRMDIEQSFHLKSLDSASVPNKSAADTKSSARVDEGQVVVSEETAIVATIEAHKAMGMLSRQEVLKLLKRSTIPLNTPPNSILYFRDSRLQQTTCIQDYLEFNKIVFGGVKCPILAILSKNGFYGENGGKYRDNFDSIKEIYESTSKRLHIQWIDGDHFIPLNKTKECAQIINRYLDSPEDFSINE